ncbi:MAG TPA: hypothetical protein VHY31_16050 [Streptosporangiaceae bacterium]|jgi:putative ABC transport system permease protein|nr:hypothetical protein [Streptosporangiaceae bacterium]
MTSGRKSGAVTMMPGLIGTLTLAAGVIAIPAGVAVHQFVLPAMAAAADLRLPASMMNVYHAWELAALALAGLVIAVAGALLPHGRGAAHRVARQCNE